MNILRIGFLGTRTTNFQQTADFFQNILGLKPAWAEPGPMIAFIVDAVVSAYAEVEAAEIEVLGEIFWAAEGFGWFFLRAPDGNIYCIEQVPD